MKKLRFGIIGIGNMGSSHVIRLTENEIPEAELTAVCDINPDRLKWAEEKLGDSVARYSDYHEMLASGKIDAALVATPHYSHPQIGIDVLEAGIHLLSEKPIGVYTKKVRELYAVAEKHPELVFGIDYNQRTDSKYQKIREMVQNGEVGEIQRIIFIVTDWFRTQAYYNSGGWRATWAGEGGGVLINQDPHQLDLWQWICGVPKRIQAFTHEGHHHDIEVEDDVTAYFEYENGASGVFITTTGEYPGTNRLEISGTKGQIVFSEDGEIHFAKLSNDSRDYIKNADAGFGEITYEKTTIPVEQKGEFHTGIVKNFTSAVLHGTPLLAPGIEGINGLSISNAMMLSSWKHDWVELPNDGEEFYQYLEEKIKHSKAKGEVKQVVFSTEGSYGNK